MKGHATNSTECLECDLPAQERLNYFTGQFLTERDFRDEQQYHIGKHRQHNRYLHGSGTVCGLRVTQHPNPECRDRFVIIEPGLALDCCGREISLAEKVYVDLNKYLAGEADDTNAAAKQLLISVCYEECKTEIVPALYSECGCDQSLCEANRVHEGFEVDVRLLDKLPEQKPKDAPGINLDWTTTINQKNVYRLALDKQNNRLFVMDSQATGHVMVYDTGHQCLMGSIDLDGQGLSLALSPDGNFLYAIRRQNNKDFFRVVDVQDLTNLKIVNDLELAAGAKEPRIGVATATTKVFTLDPNNATADKRCIRWKADINSTNFADAAAATDLTVNPGTGASEINVSADGQWLFAAIDGNKVNAIKIDPIAPPVSHQLNLSGKAVALATSGDSTTLYVATDDKKVHGFHVQETPAVFPTIGTGADVGPGDPIAIATSPSGKWAYVLLKEGGKGNVRVIDSAKLELDAAHAVSDPVAVADTPRDLLVSEDGRQVYAAGEGTNDLCGGVSILDVTETQCCEIFWRALDGCPECEEDCVLLAVVKDYKKGTVVTDELIDNHVRRLSPSTATLHEAICCVAESGGGGQGTEGPRGAPGLPGTDGVNGAKWFNGAGAPAGPTGADGDYYLDTNNGDVYEKGGGTWTKIGNLKGANGTPGTIGAKWFNGAGAPAAATGLDGDYYLDTGNGDVYEKFGGTWTKIGNIKGANGTNGTNGTNGANGVNGATWFNGVGAPSAATGVNGDYYLDTNLGNVFKKTGGAWTNVGNIKGPKGDNGLPGDPGPGLEDGLTRITALSWGHGLGNNPLVDVKLTNGGTQKSIVIRFSRPVLTLSLNASFGFEVRIPDPAAQIGTLLRYFNVRGSVIKVTNIQQNAVGIITGATQTQATFGEGLAFTFLAADVETVMNAPLVKVRLQGDFVVDVDGRAVDAEFVRAELPTGDRPKPSTFGIQGGLFESWFKVTPFQLLLNEASPEELMNLPGVSRTIAEAIVARRERTPFRSVNELLEIRGVGRATFDGLRKLVSID